MAARLGEFAMTPGSLLGMVLVAWVAAVAVLILYRILTARIPLAGLFTADGQSFSPERLQLFAMLLFALSAYVGMALQSGKMPDLPEEVLLLLGGSNALYLAGKVARSP